MTSFTTAAGDGSVVADTVTATTATIGTTTGNLVGNVTGNVSGGGTLSSVTMIPQLIAAAGATQGAATAITGLFAIITTSTASARGVKLPTAATGKTVYLTSLCTQGSKVYPFAGDKITSSATNAAVVIAGFKGNIYLAKDATTWTVIKGA